MFESIKTNCIWCVSQNSRYLDKISVSMKKLGDDLINQTRDPVILYSDLFMLQCLLFNEPITRGGASNVSPSQFAKRSLINNSSIKLLSVLKYLFDGAYSIDYFKIEMTTFTNDQIPEVRKILVVGTINDPFVECLRRAYPTIDIKGFGVDAQGKNLRACIEGVGGKNMTCDMLISDVDQTYYHDFIEMENATISYILSFLSWSPVVAVKLNYHSQRIFNFISSAIRDAFPSKDYQGYPVSVSCQNAFTLECYFFIYPNYYVNTLVDLHVYFENEHTFTTKAYQLSRSDLNMSTRPVLIDSVRDKGSFSLYHPSDDCQRACPMPQNRLAGGSYIALTSHIKRAEHILPVLLESCDTVETWKTSSSSELIHFLGSVSNFRLSITKRSTSHYYLKMQSRGFGVNSFGVRTNPPRFLILRFVPWYSIVSEACRTMLMKQCERDKDIKRVFSIASRNLTVIFVLRNYENVTCYDEYRSGGTELFRKYNFHVDKRYFD